MKFSLLTLSTLAASASAAYEFNALSYNAKQLDNGDCPTVNSVRDDLKVLSKYTNEVRIYSVNDCNQGEPVLRAMEGTDWKVQLGLWVGKDDESYNKDKKELLRLAGVFDFKKHVSSVIVGNEAIYREEQTSAQIADKVREVKAALKKIDLGDIPVTSSETWPSYDKTLVDAVDYVNMHAFPFWEGTNIDGAQDKVFEHIYDIQKIAGSKAVVVGETGWPDAGGNFENAKPSLKNEQRYMREFICRANLEKIKYVWFSAFDEAWKPVSNASDVETHWGIMKGDKSPKFESPMYDCKGFVPNSKPGESSSSDDEGSSDDNSSESDDNIDSDSGVEDKDADSETGDGNDTESSSSWSIAANGYMMTSTIAASVAALAAASFF
ncbi:glycoside hydrolase 3 protein [Coemansia guatemalensis]|uniref:glucan endo-1,3-beta-D-glucosidase n=1 Tax=Coemansia guatemalensis TaxID=2761395 RepID=A0A9W8LW36_9FUNG|nr:glycoside hydrolase 3 protein [Coemansia guatemalensis]